MSGTNERRGEAAVQSRRLNGRMLGKLLVLAVAMFGFGYAMVPIYKKICEVTGANALTRRDPGAEQFAKNTQVDRSRKVVVEFDANSQGTWLFKPERTSIEVHPGELATVVYDLTNTKAAPVAGHAIPSYAPQQSAQYFRKVECFCFEQHTLEANQTRKFPVVFVVDPNLPKEVTTITLSYTFFEVAGKAGAAASAAAPPPSGASGG